MSRTWQRMRPSVEPPDDGLRATAYPAAMCRAVILTSCLLVLAGCDAGPRKPRAKAAATRSKAAETLPARAARAPAARRTDPPPAAPPGPAAEPARPSPLDEFAGRPIEMPKPATSGPPSSERRPATGRWVVVSVHDGDTVLCLDEENRQRKVRLVGIDAPEIGQPFGTKARDGLRGMVLRQTVTLHEQGEDRYGRTLGSLAMDGQDVALRMVAAGLAWQFTRYSDDAALAAAEREARAARLGLWADAEPVPPWEWRATERERKAAPAER